MAGSKLWLAVRQCDVTVGVTFTLCGGGGGVVHLVRLVWLVSRWRCNKKEELININILMPRPQWCNSSSVKSQERVSGNNLLFICILMLSVLCVQRKLLFCLNCLLLSHLFKVTSSSWCLSSSWFLLNSFLFFILNLNYSPLNSLLNFLIVLEFFMLTSKLISIY